MRVLTLGITEAIEAGLREEQHFVIAVKTIDSLCDLCRFEQRAFDVLLLPGGKESDSYIEQLCSIGLTLPIIAIASGGEPLEQQQDRITAVGGLVMTKDKTIAELCVAAEGHMLSLRDRETNPRVAELSLSGGRLIILYHAPRVIWDGIVIRLTSNQHRMLLILAENRNRIVRRERLARDTTNSDENYFKGFSVSISILRKTLNNIGLRDSIKAVRREGYIFVEPH